MIVFPYCKINLGLNIVARRADAFHDLETIFLPIKQLHDALEVLPMPASSADQNDVVFTSSGLPISGDPESNLCIKAYRSLKEEHPQLPPVRMHLHKVIPMGAGLGGGSADGAFTLKLLNDLFRLGISNERLEQHALRLGSDCPFFIKGITSFASGRGEVLEPIDLDLSGHSIVLINPGIHVNTGWAFQQIFPAPPLQDLRDLIRQPIGQWKGIIQNDFQHKVESAHPLIGSICQRLYVEGALYASMSGSGSTVYGIFGKGSAMPKGLFPGCFEVHATL